MCRAIYQYAPSIFKKFLYIVGCVCIPGQSQNLTKHLEDWRYRASLYIYRLSIEVDRRMRNAWCSFRKHTLELYDRPSAPLELKIRMLRDKALETMLYDCVTWSLRASHYDTLRRAHHRFLTRCIGWRKHNHPADHPIFYLDTLIKTGSESIEATLRRRRILFAGFVARMEDTRLPKCVCSENWWGARAVV